MKSFVAKLEPVPHGGLYVLVPEKAAAGLRHGLRVRGTVNGAAYRSSLMKYSGRFHLGVHKATARVAGVEPGARVKVTIEPDDEPLPTDTTPPDLARALRARPAAHASFTRLAPAVRRGFVNEVMGAKKPETRARRIEKIVATLSAGVPPRRTWTPKTAPGK